MSTSSALMKLIGNEVVGGGRKSVLGGLTKASTKMAEKEGANIAKKLVVDEISEKTPSVLRVFTKDNPMSLQEAYERTASMRNAHASNKRMLTEASGKELYKNFPNDFMELDNSNPYAKKLFGDYDNAISREIGSENASKLRNILGNYARLDNKDFEGSRNMVKNFLNSKDSDAVVNKSRDLLEDAGVYRAHNSPDGISWTTKPSVAMQYIDESLHPDGTKILEGEIHPNNRVIAPQFTERYQPALAQHEVIGDPSGIQQVGKTKMVELLKGEGINTDDINVANALRYMKPKNGGNYGHLGRAGEVGGSLPKAQKHVDDRVTLYRGLEQEYDPNYPVSRLDTSGYESWTDNPELAKQYGDYVYSIDVPKADIKTSYLDENPNSLTYGDRNPIYSIDKKAGLNGVKGNEYLLEVGSDYQKGLKYNLVEPDNEMSMAIQKSGVKSDVAKRAENYLGGRMLDKTGKPVTFYHSTPNEFSKFDDAMLGSNTGHENTKLGHFVTTDKEFSKKFLGDNGSGRTMELDANIKNPITHPYMAGLKYEGEELDNIVAKYLEATDNQELLQTLSEYAKENGTSLYDEYMDLTVGETSPFEFAEDERKLLQSKGYDAAEVIEGMRKDLLDSSTENVPVSSYAVFDSNNLKPVVADSYNDPNIEKAIKQSGADKYLGEPKVDYSLADDADAGLSPAQREFFKDSVVRDENGNLIPMYHGTRGDFTIFGDKSTSSSSNGHSSVGYWFSPNEEGAKNFANSIWYGDGQPKAMKTYLNIKNPKVYESVDNSKAVGALRDKLAELELQAKSNSSYPKLYYKNMYHASVVDNMVRQGNKDMAIKWLSEKSGYDDKTATDLVEEIADRRNLEIEKKKLEDELDELKYSDAYERFRTDLYKIDGQKAGDANVGGIGMSLNDKNSVQKYVDKLKSEGYDGIIIKGTHYDSDTMGGINDQYVVFDPEQIKDVNNLNPTTNPDINYSEIATANGGVLDEKTNRAIEIIAQADNFGSPVKNKLYDKIDPSTLPKGYSELSKLLDSASSSDNVIAKRVAEKIGTDSPLDADLDKVLDYLYVGDNREKRVFKQVLEDKIKKFEKDAKALGLDIDDPRDRMTKSEMYKLFGKAWNKAKQEEIDKIVQMSDGADIMNALMDTAHRGIRTGTAGGLDTALSERLGIAPGNTIKISSDRYGDYGNPQSAGRYNRHYKDIAINSKGSKVESQVSTMAHERLHSFQNEARPDNLGRYSKEVSDAYLELQKDLSPFLKDKKEIAKRYGEDKADYWASDIEQEARMLQNYLDNTGITNDALSKTAKGEWGDEIKPAFDKFFNKLRTLSKKGIALPAIAGLVGIGAMAGEKDNKKLDNAV